MQTVTINPVPLPRLGALLSPDRADLLYRNAERTRSLLDGRIVWNVNATAHGGGVAEMLQALLAYGRGAGVDTRWLVLDGDPEFYAVTKRLHNRLHGSSGDGGELGAAEREHYLQVTRANLADVAAGIRPDDIVLLHDPQTAGLVQPLMAIGAKVVWRCHIGMDTRNPVADTGWEFLRPFVEPADGVIFSRVQYAPPWTTPERTFVIPPSIDPFTAKNSEMSDVDVAAALRQADLVDVGPDGGSIGFTRRDGSAGWVRPHHGLVVGGAPIPGHVRLVMQVSRWDRLKDMTGVLRGFAEHLGELPPDAHLALVGPDVSGVTDDPEGAEVLAECEAIWRDLDDGRRSRIHLCSLPMDDVDENAHLVNALQRRASVVVQKSLVEGFGLTVTEPMWKAKPVVASAVGGIKDQIQDGVSGVLLPDPSDLDRYVEVVDAMLTDEQRAAALGSAAKERIRDQFLGDRHLVQYAELFGRLG